MKVEHFGGAIELADSSHLDEILRERFGDEANEFLISGQHPYPYLTIQVHGPFSCLHFFPNQDHPGFLSVGRESGSGSLTFYTNTPTEEIEVDVRAVVPFEQALEAAKEFMKSGAMPDSIQWIEL